MQEIAKDDLFGGLPDGQEGADALRKPLFAYLTGDLLDVGG